MPSVLSLRSKSQAKKKLLKQHNTQKWQKPNGQTDKKATATKYLKIQKNKCFAKYWIALHEINIKNLHFLH